MIILNIFYQEPSSWRFFIPGENMAKFEDCQITYQVELETKNLQEESKKVREELKELNNSDSKASKGLDQLETSAKIRATLSTNLIAM